MLPDPQEVASRIAAKIRQRKVITRKHRNIHIVLAFIFWTLNVKFLTLMTLAFLDESGNSAHKWAYSVCFILTTIFVIFPTFMAFTLHYDGEKYPMVFEWYFQRFLTCFGVFKAGAENSESSNRYRLSSDSDSSTMTVHDIRIQAIPRVIFQIDDGQGQFRESEDSFELDVFRPIQVAADINLQKACCSQPSSCSEDSSVTVSANLTSVTPDQKLTGSSLFVRQTSPLNDSELSASNPELNVLALRERLELIQQQASAVDCQRYEVLLPGQVSCVETQQTVGGSLRRRQFSSEDE